MNCPFCNEKLHHDGYYLEHRGYNKYSCTSLNCMVNMDFSRYKCVLDVWGNLYRQEYALDRFYVKVDEWETVIYRLTSCLIDNAVSVQSPLWLNFTNFERTLDRLKICVTFS